MVDGSHGTNFRTFFGLLIMKSFFLLFFLFLACVCTSNVHTRGHGQKAFVLTPYLPGEESTLKKCIVEQNIMLVGRIGLDRVSFSPL